MGEIMSASVHDRSRYQRLTDLYVLGGEIELQGEVIWLQAINAFERDDALAAAGAARARFSLAVKDEETDEHLSLRAMYLQDGHDGAVSRIVEAKRPQVYSECLDEMESEEDWKEKISLLRMGDSVMTPPTEDEQIASRKMLVSFSDEIEKRIEEGLVGERDQTSRMPEEDIWDAYQDWWVDKHGGEISLVEYRRVEAFYAARSCVGEKSPDGHWNHSACESHHVRIFDTKDDMRTIPDEMLAIIFAGLAGLEVTEREARKAEGQGSSTEPSPLPSAPEESAPSTSTEALPTAPGISLQPSTTH